MFDDVIQSNAEYRARFHDPRIEGRAARGLAVLTCIDSRIDPLAMLGLKAGDAKIIRNAGARVTEDAMRSLILAVNLLGVDRVCVVQHSDCAMVGHTNEEILESISEKRGVTVGDWDFLPYQDHLETLRRDISVIKDSPLLPNDLSIGGFVFDVRTGELLSLTNSWEIP
jgi:carbonic anhydrase